MLCPIILRTETKIVCENQKLQVLYSKGVVYDTKPSQTTKCPEVIKWLRNLNVDTRKKKHYKARMHMGVQIGDELVLSFIN